MKRRNFLQLGAVLAASVANRLYAAKSAVPGVVRGLQIAPPLSSDTRQQGVKLLDVVAGKTVPLGSRDSRYYSVSVDDITQDNCLDFAVPTSNALVISAYNRNSATRRGRKIKDGALQRAVLSKLQNLSPDDYQRVNTAFDNDDQMQPGRVFPFELKIPTSNRSSFPVDCLIVSVFEAISSENEHFKWVKTAFEIAAEKQADLLIVPCLGRDWHDKNTIAFEDFFRFFLEEVPDGSRPASVHFSLYSQWPSFELEDAVKSLNSEWKRPVS